jgi:hypothetical protein
MMWRRVARCVVVWCDEVQVGAVCLFPCVWQRSGVMSCGVVWHGVVWVPMGMGRCRPIVAIVEPCSRKDVE